MLPDHRRRKIQRMTVGVLVGALVLALALSLISVAWADGLTPSPPPAGSGVTLARGEDGVQANGSPATPTSAPLGSPSSAPRPVTKTPQGQATQVSDHEHIGGLVGYLAFMLGGVLLLVRGRRRERRARTSTPILS